MSSTPVIPPIAPDIQDTSTPPLMPTSQPQPPPVPVATGPAQAPASAGVNSPAPGGVLGDIAIGSLSAVAKRAVATRQNPIKAAVSGVGGRLSNLAQNSPYSQELQKNALDRQAKQQEIATAKQKAQQDAVKATDEHTESAIRTNGLTLDNIHKVAENTHIESMYPDQEAGEKLVLQGQLRTQNEADQQFAATLVEAGVPIDETHGAGHDGLTQSHAQDVASGKITMLNNGKTGEQAGYGIVDNTALQNTPLPHDISVVSDYTLDAKTGEIKPVYTTLSGGHNTAWDALITHGAASQKFQLLQNQYADQLKNKSTQADTAEKEAAKVKDLAEANNQNKQADLLGGDVINHTAQQLVDADEDPSQLTKRSKNYDAQVAAADDYSLRNYGVHWSPAQATLDYNFAKAPATQNTLKYLNSLTGKDGRGGNLKVLVDSSNKIDRTDFPAVNNYEAWAKLQAGNPAMAAYYAQITEVADQVAKILQAGGTGNGTSDAKLKQATDLFNKGFSKQSIQAVAEALHPLLGNRQKEMIGNNRYLIKQYPEAVAPNGASSIATGSDGKQYYLDARGKPISVVGYGVR